ncbi:MULTISPECIES: RNA polymerase factor sigma-70 [Pseudomonas]|jgi:RNA polymerase sigma-70 factor (ECF subfamily)|uniref:RNA polymerase factor sigma-70 n=1 Tax=Pseudomonas TaxID=286 RepID=UPI0004D6819A|nr:MULTISPECIES: RNA polymerase factor sigma-70 [Pseudomonas]KES21037.1 RNA polymerase sigma70 [Pseudomonas sp. AAC]KWR70695.1 RNA polymerase subunit sigma-70 [Pseudomonas sp. PI1]MBH3436385.1 RNA polymerase factor sigma-70 [Pseudomonas citronellolis]OHR77691.1 RNA polymerase subunit sigma-70 [Pseudomonas sp. HMSC75E02]GLU36617.1 DNA-directed RNA polymerase sigma-70 factor [Pseudomonas sp. NBRC 100443]
MLDELPTSRYASPLVATFIENRSILVKFASRFLGCRSHAEDVVQDTFFRLQNASGASIPLKAQMSYLFQVVRNLAIDHYRKQALEQRHTGAPQELMEAEAAYGATPETLHINFDTLEQIDEALSQLPERTRYAFEMYRLHGVQQKEIARELGVSPTLVNFMIRDALLHCCASVAKDEQPARRA